MTTIACDGKTIISDSRCTDENLKTEVQKIFKVGSDYIGIAGNYSDGLLFVEWYQDKRRRKPHVDELEVIVLTPKGVFHYDPALIPMKVNEKFYAVGSGRDFAIGAYMAGATIQEAVEIACMCDVYSAKPLQVSP